MWFKVKQEDLVPLQQPAVKETKPVKTRQVDVFFAAYYSDNYYRGDTYIHEEIATKTSATDAYAKAVEGLMNHPNFSPLGDYKIRVTKRVVHEPIEDKNN